ncbi:MAG: DUF927 domain-containing protein [Chloroflexi bacterium]|nr:DUF927 domain-containing protein [Chloroflexota bacterium]
MKLLEFLAAVMPQTGVRVIARTREGLNKRNKPFTYFQHLPCNTHEQAQQAVKQIVKATDADVYYALATFKQSFHSNNKGKKVIRVRENVSKLKALWLDIDFKHGLSDHTQVVAALREFSNRSGMPMPSILVHSGNGIHAYWPFEEEIDGIRWQALANGLKQICQDHGLAADHACTADPCRVLRPIGTLNRKDPDNPKIVKGISTGALFDPSKLEAALLGERNTADETAVPLHLRGVVGTGYTELQGHVGGRREVESFFSEIIPQCGALRYAHESRGADCSEPEWVGVLQILKHTSDGQLFIHEVSDGHADYTPEDTKEKFQQRLDNDAGPTLCSTFATYRPEICKACPHWNKIKTPLSLGEEKPVTATGKEFPLKTWRPIEGHMGMERKMFDPGSNQYYWEKKLSRSWELKTASRAIADSHYSYTVVSRLGKGKPIEIDLPGFMLGSPPDLKKTLAEAGAPLVHNEVNEWMILMSTWLQELQKARTVGDAVDRMGWIEALEDKHIDRLGFTAGTSSFLRDGTHKTGLRISAEYQEIAKHYTPVGELSNWRKAADFITDQDNPAFTAVLASAFAAPIFGFTNMPGAMLTVVSTHSGVGKTSAMKVAQAVWGSPSNGMNSTTDTHLSVIRKVAFLKNLPIYWDEIRGQKSLENFYHTAFDVAQGKERTRLDSGAKMRTINTWKTMVVGASNESLFDYMAQQGGASNAATARTFEIVVDPFDDPTRAARNAMFGVLDTNYGVAGQVFSEYLATNDNKIQNATAQLYERLYTDWKLNEGERFWAAICATLLLGAALANACGLTRINEKTLSTFLRDNVTRLRVRTNSSMLGSTPRELVIGYLQAHQDGQMVIDAFPAPGQTALPQMLSQPSSRLMIVKGGDMVRIRKQDFTDWLRKSKNLTFSAIEEAMGADLQMRQLNTKLAGGTKWELPKSRCLELIFDDSV